MDTFWSDSSQDLSADITTPTPETVIARFTFPHIPADTSSSVAPLLQQESPQPRPSNEARRLYSPQRRSRRNTGRYNRLTRDTLPAKEGNLLIASVDDHSSEGMLPQLSRPLLYRASIPPPSSPQRSRSYPTIRTANCLRSSFKSLKTVSHKRSALPTSLETALASISRLPAPTMSPKNIAVPSSHLISKSTSSKRQLFEEEVGGESGEPFQTRSSSSASLSPPRGIGIPERRVTHKSELSYLGVEDKASFEEQEQIEISSFHREFTQTSTSSSPTPMQEIWEARKKINLKLLQSPRRQSRRSTAAYSRLLEDTVLSKEVGSESEEPFQTRSSYSATPSPPRVIGVPERRVTHQSELSYLGVEDKAYSEEQEQEQIEISSFHREFTQTSTSSSPTPQQEIWEPRKKINLKLLQSPLRQSRRRTAGFSRLLEDTVLAKESSDDGDAYSRPLATSRTESSDDGDAYSRPLATSRTEIDPFLVGPLIVQMALRENQRLDDELKRNAKSMYWLEQKDQPCPCDVRHHPSWWSLETIDNVHKYSFLLNCRDLELKTERVIAGNNRNTVIVYDVPMENGHPWKMKAEQVMRYVDVETGVGDQTAYNVHYYIQPCDRKVFLVISSHRVVGLVVAEPQQTAHRVLHETQSYRDLEEQAVPVRVGINRLWVHVSMRRLHLATLLCSLVRHLFYAGERLNMEDLAFNNVSDAGVAFAKIFLKTLRVPLYDGKTGIRPAF